MVRMPQGQGRIGSRRLLVRESRCARSHQSCLTQDRRYASRLGMHHLLVTQPHQWGLREMSPGFGSCDSTRLDVPWLPT